MIKVMFVCHGNICRSTMAEFVLKDMVAKQGLGECFEIASSATSREEIGNPVHSGTKRKLAEHGIGCEGKRAVQFTKRDYTDYDFVIAMDQNNIRNLQRIIGEDSEHKVSLLLDYTDRRGNIADPWYTGDFEETWQDVKTGCEGFLRFLKEKGLL